MATFREHLLKTFGFLADAGFSLEIETALRLAGPFVPRRSAIHGFAAVQPVHPCTVVRSVRRDYPSRRKDIRPHPCLARNDALIVRSVCGIPLHGLDGHANILWQVHLRVDCGDKRGKFELIDWRVFFDVEPPRLDKGFQRGFEGLAAVVGVPSRKGALRTIAAVHHQKNHAVATPHIRLIECRNGVVYDDREINCLLILGVRDVPNLEATPTWMLSGKR